MSKLFIYTLVFSKNYLFVSDDSFDAARNIAVTNLQGSHNMKSSNHLLTIWRQRDCTDGRNYKRKNVSFISMPWTRIHACMSARVILLYCGWKRIRCLTVRCIEYWMVYEQYTNIICTGVSWLIAWITHRWGIMRLTYIGNCETEELRHLLNNSSILFSKIN